MSWKARTSWTMGMFEADSPRAARSGRRDSSFPASAIGSALPHEHVSTRRHINWPRARPRLPVRALHPTLPRSSPRLPPPPRNNTTSRQSHYNHDRQEHIGGTKDAAGDHQCASELPLSPVASVYRFRCRYAPASPSLAHSHLSCRPDR